MTNLHKLIEKRKLMIGEAMEEIPNVYQVLDSRSKAL
jgi:hypothetical protein